MKRSFLEKLEERRRELDIALKVWIELGGDDEEPAHLMRAAVPPRKLGGGRAQPLLTVRRREETASEKPPRRQPRRKGHTHAERVLGWFKSHPGATVNSGRLMSEFKAETKDEKQRIYIGLYVLKKAGVLTHERETGGYSLARQANGAQ